MSHYTTLACKLTISDVEAMKDAAKELGLHFKVGGKVRYYYSHGVQNADYVISIDGCPFDVGIIKEPNGNLRLVYDDYQGHVEKVLGKGCHKLIQSTIFHKIRRACNQKGRPILKRMEKGKMMVEIML